MKSVVILRGCAGSGKTTYAQRLKSRLNSLLSVSCVVCSADDYFTHNGTYHFDHAKLGAAHEACRKAAHEALTHGINVVVIDNTNISRYEFKDYIDYAIEFGYCVVERAIGLDLDLDTLVKRGTHKVPREKVESTLRRLKDSIRNRG